jgi:hypothetical protein
LPFSVVSRNSADLLKNLQINDAPILFEGLKTVYWIHKNHLTDRNKILRLHNIEHHYFQGISASETNFFRKIIFTAEAAKFASFEKVISKFNKVLTLSNFENRHVQSEFNNAAYIPVFHGNEKVEQLDGIGKYALYHGDLRMSDNLRVVFSLIAIFREIPQVKLVIAGNAKGDVVRQKIGNATNISFVQIDNFTHLTSLLREAHVNLIFSYQKSGTKLKLMTALFNSRFCVINDNIMDDEQVSGLCEHASSDAEIKAKVLELQNKAYNGFEQRRNVLETYMNDHHNAQLLIDQIWN